MDIYYGKPLPCGLCGSKNIGVIHSFGAQCFCRDCKAQGMFVSGSNYQSEEYAAVDMWNKQITEHHHKDKK
jgi:hypothetical protein